MLVYTNTDTGTNVWIQEMFRLVGRCGRPACGKYVAVSGANKNLLRMYYKNEHGEVPDNFNPPDHYDVVKFDKMFGEGGGNVYDVTKKMVVRSTAATRGQE